MKNDSTNIEVDSISANQLYQLASAILPSYVKKEDWEKPLAGKTVIKRDAVDGIIGGVMSYARGRVRREQKE